MKRLSAVHFLVGVVALVIGLAVGGLGPRAEIRALRAQLDAAGECEQNNMGSEIANVFRGRPWEEGREPPKVTRFEAEPSTDNPFPAGHPPDAGPLPEPGIDIQFGDDAPSEDLGENLDLARDAMNLRYKQARAALMEDANPSPEQVDAIDASMDRMNDSLMGLATDLVDQMSGDGQPTRRDTMLYAAETLDVVLSAEDELRGILDEGQIAALQDESLDPLSYVDPSIVDVLSQLDGLQ